MELGPPQTCVRPTDSKKMHEYQYIATYSWISGVKEGRTSQFENTQLQLT